MDLEECYGEAPAGGKSGDLWNPPAGADGESIRFANANEFRPDQPFVNAYVEIKNALWIRSNPVYWTALEEWERQELFQRKEVNRKKKRASEVTFEIYQLIEIFCVFTGLVINTVAQLPNVLHRAGCRRIWSPLSLTVLAFVFTVGGIWYKFEDLRTLESSIYVAKQLQTEAAARAEILRQEGPRFKFHESMREPMREQLHSKIRLTSFFVILGLSMFTVLILLSYFVILCDSFIE